VSAEDAEFLFDVAKRAAPQFSCESREILNFGALIGYQVELRSAGHRFQIQIKREEVEADRGAVELKLKGAVERLLAKLKQPGEPE
jgi:hypothetical protein